MSGFTWGGPDGATWGGSDGATWGAGEPSTPEDLKVEATGPRTVELEWSNVGVSESINVYSSIDDDGPDEWERIASVDYPAESFVDDDQSKLDAERYWYRVTAENAVGESDPSGEVLTDALPIPPAEELVVEDVDGRHATLSWTDPSNNADGYRLLLKRPEDEEYKQDGDDIDPVEEGETVTHETTELLDGQEYTATVETYAGDLTAREDD